MANEKDIVVEFDDLEKELQGIKQEEVVPTIEEKTTPVVDEDEDIPTKFKGKSKKDIVKSYEDLESEYGRRGNEIGDLRKVVDQYITQQLSPKDTSIVEEEDITFDKFVNDPTTTIDKRVEAKVNKRVKEVDERLNQIELENSIREFQVKHPDYYEINQDKDFQTWINSSPSRLKRYQAADKFDMTAADELMTDWKERKELMKSISKSDEAEQRQEELNAAISESGSTGVSSRKIYRRTDLVRLRNEKPDVWAANEAEFMRAYAEGRVK